MNEELERISSRMLSEGKKTIAYFKSLPAEAWNAQVYTTGTNWNIRQILAHFLSAERGLTALVRDIITEGGGAPEEFDIDEFNEGEVADLADLETQALLDAFGDARTAFSELVGSLTAQDLDRMGRHPWFGDTELRKALKLVYRHNMIHLRDIRKALETGQPVPHFDAAPPSGVGEG